MLHGLCNSSTARGVGAIPGSRTLLLALQLPDWGLSFPFLKMELLPPRIFLALESGSTRLRVRPRIHQRSFITVGTPAGPPYGPSHGQSPAGVGSQGFPAGVWHTGAEPSFGLSGRAWLGSRLHAAHEGT